MKYCIWCFEAVRLQAVLIMSRYKLWWALWWIDFSFAVEAYRLARSSTLRRYKEATQ